MFATEGVPYSDISGLRSRGLPRWEFPLDTFFQSIYFFGSKRNRLRAPASMASRLSDSR